MINVWTDGACSGNVGGWACLLEDGEADSGVGGRTNNEAELLAILWALELCPSCSDILVHTDSQLAIGLLTSWHTSKPHLVGLVKAIKTQALGYGQRLDFLFTKGHSRDANNIKVDRLARQEARYARLCIDRSAPSVSGKYPEVAGAYAGQTS